MKTGRIHGLHGSVPLLAVRHMMPKTTWSLWARLEQILAKIEAPRTNLWKMLETRLVGHDSAGEGMHVRIQAELNARAQAAALAAAGEERHRKLCNSSAAGRR